MKRILVFFIVGVLALSSYAQNNDNKKLSREERKEQKKKEHETELKLVDSLLKTKQFVLEADLLQSKGGRTVSVSNTINFIIVENDKATFQFGSVHLIGVNGVGGLTVEGNITNMKIEKEKNSYYVAFTISSSSGFFDITMDVYSLSSVTADVATTLSNKKISYSGQLNSLQESSVYKGYSR